MRKIMVTLLVLLTALPAAALPRRFRPGSSLCWCLCDATKASAADTIVMWEKTSASCGLSAGKNCNAQQPNMSYASGTLKSCDGCQIGSDGNCIAGSAAIKPPPNGQMLPGPPTGNVTPVQPAGTATQTTPTR